MNEAKFPEGPCRELYFHERNTEQKIAKMADAIQYLVAKLKEMNASVELLSEHSHADGKIVVPMAPEGRENRFSESYFFKNPLGVEKP